MEDLLELSKEDFNKQVIIQFDNIMDGFNNYENNLITPKSTRDLEGCEKDITSFIKSLYKLNGNNLIIDFYFSKLSEDEFERLYSSLNVEDKSILMDIKSSNSFKSNYFLVKNEEIIEFLVRLCTKELFFITFYFTKHPLTLWGNYDLKFPMFYNNKEDIEMYLSLIEEYNLKIT